MTYDIIIIGAGVTGSAAARYLSNYDARIAVVERAEDVCAMGASKANSAIVHAGFDAAYGSLMARFNVEGSRMMEPLSKQLNFDYSRIGSIVVCMDSRDMPRLEALYANGIKNGVEGLELLYGEAIQKIEPKIKSSAYAALWAPTGAIICPFALTAALAENAAANGAEFIFNTTVTAIAKEQGLWSVQTDRGLMRARAVINAAGTYADVLHNMVSRRHIHITPRRGEYMLLDKSVGSFVSRTVFQLPTELGKGVLISPTVHGNIIVGPTAEDIMDRDGVNTTAAGLELIREKACLAVDDGPLKQVITSFSGLRAHEVSHEFIVGEAEDAEFFFDLAGIESPGLSSAPAIGKYISEMVAERLGLDEKPDFIATREGILDPKRLSSEERNRLIKREPAYGRIVCRCEEISEGEIIDAIRRTPGARSLDGVKRRVRAGMGRCQGGFCSTRVMEILARELGVDIAGITKSGGASRLISGLAKQDKTAERG